MEDRLKKLLENNRKRKDKAPRRKLGNRTKVWSKDVLKGATIEVE